MFDKGVPCTFRFGKLVLQIVLLFGQNVAGVDEGFEMFFKSQKRTYHDVKVNFTNPLPSWLKGTYVSTRFRKRLICHIFVGET